MERKTIIRCGGEGGIRCSPAGPVGDGSDAPPEQPSLPALRIAPRSPHEKAPRGGIRCSPAVPVGDESGAPPERPSLPALRIAPNKSGKTKTGRKIFRCGGEGGIRTLERLLTVTRFPVVRPLFWSRTEPLCGQRGRTRPPSLYTEHDP